MGQFGLIESCSIDGVNEHLHRILRRFALKSEVTHCKILRIEAQITI